MFPFTFFFYAFSEIDLGKNLCDQEEHVKYFPSTIINSDFAENKNPS
jgi:hypothetical protein